jgi:hypothetical protein
METSTNHWLPLTEYALRSGMSISTLRRKIKSNSIEFKMEEGRYLIKSDEFAEPKPTVTYASSDQAPQLPSARPTASAPMAAQPIPRAATVETAAPVAAAPQALPPTPPAHLIANSSAGTELAAVREELRRMQEDSVLRWRALEARVAGLVKKIEFFSEQMAETKMLVKIFEEKLDHRA